MICINEDCPWRQIMGPVDCPAANNGCRDYRKMKFTAEEAQDADTLHRALGVNWFARDIIGDIYGFTGEPPATDLFKYVDEYLLPGMFPSIKAGEKYSLADICGACNVIIGG